MADLLFFQNYYNGWGYTYVASWSLAVEEHFYFGLAIVFGGLLVSRYKNLWIANLDKYLIVILLLILVIRGITVYTNEASSVHNITNTHLRIDTLLIGVLISYWYYFKKEDLRVFFCKIPTIFTCYRFSIGFIHPFCQNGKFGFCTNFRHFVS